MSKKKYVRFQIADLKTKAAYRLGLHRDYEGAMLLHSLIEDYVDWEAVQAEAADVRKVAKDNGLI